MEDQPTPQDQAEDELDARLNALPVMEGVTDYKTYCERKTQLSRRIENLENIQALQRLDAATKKLAVDVIAGWPPPPKPQPKPEPPADARAAKRLLAQFMANCEQTFERLLQGGADNAAAQANVANAAARLTHAAARAAEMLSRLPEPRADDTDTKVAEEPAS